MGAARRGREGARAQPGGDRFADHAVDAGRDRPRRAPCQTFEADHHGDGQRRDEERRAQSEPLELLALGANGAPEAPHEVDRTRREGEERAREQHVGDRLERQPDLEPERVDHRRERRLQLSGRDHGRDGRDGETDQRPGDDRTPAAGRQHARRERHDEEEDTGHHRRPARRRDRCGLEAERQVPCRSHEEGEVGVCPQHRLAPEPEPGQQQSAGNAVPRPAELDQRAGREVGDHRHHARQPFEEDLAGASPRHERDHEEERSQHGRQHQRQDEQRTRPSRAPAHRPSRSHTPA